MNEEIETNLAAEVASVQEIDIIPAILEIVCKATGLRFSAVARVTEDRWVACAVRDEIAFGLLPGGELEIRSTICNEIRDHGQPVVIDNVSEDADFCHHHTPKQYGFQSYISIPIFRKNGAFFGTLCALDPLPMPLKSTKMETLFTLFADLISYHLDTQDRVRQKNAMLQIVQHKLDDSLDDIRQLNKISNHALQEPLRKLMFYSDMLLTDQSASEETRQFARKINSLANNFATMIRELAHYSMLGGTITDFNSVDLNTVLAAALHRLQPNIQAKKAIIYTDVLPTVPGIAPQLNQLFYYLIDNAIRFSTADQPPILHISVEAVTEADKLRPEALPNSYCKISIQDNGIGMNSKYLHQIFDLFSTLNPREQFPGIGMGLSQAKKIMRNHNGMITVVSTEGKGSTFSLIFPVDSLQN